VVRRRGESSNRIAELLEAARPIPDLSLGERTDIVVSI
jgi:hypothetical protein